MTVKIPVDWNDHDGVIKRVSGHQLRKKIKQSKTVEGFKIRPGFLYTVVRAISARINQNYDAWPADELKKSYHTFLGKPVFVNHANEDPTLARGRVVAARFVENGNDKYVEVVQEIDAQRFPRLAQEIREGGLDSVSMGAEAGFTICSFCNNKATDLWDMCDHVKFHKGEHLIDPKTREAKLVYETCHKLGFFELSYVFDPADETAVVSKVMVANKNDPPPPRKLKDDGYSDEEWQQNAEDWANWERRQRREEGREDAEYGDTSFTAHKQALSLGPENDFLGLDKPLDDFSHSGFPANADGLNDWEAQQVMNGTAPDVGHLQQLWDYINRMQNGGNGDMPLYVGSVPDYEVGEYFDWAEYNGLDPSSYNTFKSYADFLRTAGRPHPKTPEEQAAYDAFWDQKIKDYANGDSQKYRDRYAPGCPLPEGCPMHQGAKDNIDDHTPGTVQDSDYPDEGNPWDDRNPDPQDVRHWLDHEGRIAAPLQHWEKEDWELPPWAEDIPHSLVGSRHHGYGEVEAPQSIDTLRDEDDSFDEDFHHYVESPPELQDPDLSASHQLDRQQETEGLDMDRRVEDVEGIGPGGGQADPSALRQNPDARKFLPEARRYIASDTLADYSAYQTDDSPVINAFSKNNERRTMKGNPMGKKTTLADRGRVASRGRVRHYADDSGHTDGGPYGRNDQGEQEEIYFTQTPAAESVSAPDDGDSPMSNTENNLVAALQRSTQQTEYLARQLARSREAGNPNFPSDDQSNTYNAPTQPYPPSGSDPWKPENLPGSKPSHEWHNGVPPEVDKAFADSRANKAARRYYAEEVATEVNPPLSGTDEQQLKGDDFESANPQPGKETQPKDASLQVFRAFDRWLANKYQQRTSAVTYANEKFIVRMAQEFAREANFDPRSLFPTLGNVLRQARTIEAERRSAMRRRADESLDVAAPKDRIDVEKPVKNVTDADAQASQFDKGDFGSNAGDDIADPDLRTDSAGGGTFPPGDKPSTKSSAQIKKADAVQALRLAENYIKIGLLRESDKYNAVAEFTKMRAAQVMDRAYLIEAILKQQSQKKVASGVRRGAIPQSGIPAGLSGGAGFQRAAATRRLAENDPANDLALWV